MDDKNKYKATSLNVIESDEYVDGILIWEGCIDATFIW